MPYLITAILTPILAKFTELKGRRMTTTLIGQTLLVIGHLIQVLIPTCDRCSFIYVPYVLYGISYTTYGVVLYGMIPFLVEPRLIQIAYALASVFTNLSTMITPIMVVALRLWFPKPPPKPKPDNSTKA